MQYSLGFVMILLGFLGFSTQQTSNPLAEVHDSHIQGNVPSQFAKVLQRDLDKYFQDLNSDVKTVQYELLRPVPTQVGVGVPKYYLWVKLYGHHGQKNLLDEGAVKVAAVEQTHFTVLNYFAIADLQKYPETINQTFPLPVGEKIRKRIKLN
ncbi:hypothetical protein [Pseudanabaena mucicola]|uniref:DUF3888 domain-containing protein n=1 Tax=Pseudanabaena mucicola FACHB-723 TaxID=2692860 RepID=A0ABR7ZWV8_9CYAN|nr:hypothetical protein [Pseudanabaena mucicola]MBD2188254.1 hypothetical protein [Pseudanabaena mucicola FACHB-723]